MKIKITNKFAHRVKYINKNTHLNHLFRYFYYFKNDKLVGWSTSGSLIKNCIRTLKV